MTEKWRFFENLDEMVYVTDAETNELVYMNGHLRRALGHPSEEDYQGLMCYRVLQGRDTPCPFCTTHRLEPGKFLSWVHKNPVLKKRFLIKDTMVVKDGRRYRIELAIDTDSEMVCQTPYYYARNETILNECLQQIFSTTDPEDSAELLMSYIGKTFTCDRVYIFELDGDTVNNTYEWCADGIVPQKDILQRVPASVIDWWLQMFHDGQVTVISDLEDIRTQYPEAYAILKPQNVTALAVGPIRDDDQIIGFLGVDNPNPQMMSLITSLLKVVGYFTSTLLKRRDLLSQLKKLSYHDQLTGALNRNSLVEYYGELNLDSLGVIYCDITGLKQINDTLGHEAGDDMIKHCYQLLHDTAAMGQVYRTGGDEFIALFPNCSKELLLETVEQLRNAIQVDEYHMAIGYAWSDEKPLNLETLIPQADQVMYQNKRDYYRRRPGMDRRVRERRQAPRDMPLQRPNDEHAVPSTPLQNFLATAYCDMETVLQSVSQNTGSSYFYMGDMQKGLFYISDNLRDDFGFHSNLVPDFLTLWGRRISTPEFQDLFWQDISSMLREKRVVHDLRYRIRDIYGNNQLVRCYGLLKWNNDKSEPLFLSGLVTHQDMDLVVDPITNFPKEQAGIQQLLDLQKTGDHTLVIGFCLNGLTEINSTKGRAFSDRLLKHFANALTEHLCWKMSFYRLDGIRFMALVNPVCIGETPEQLVEQIRTIATDCYRSMGISRQNICSFAVFEYPMPGLHVENVVENLTSLIRVAKQDGQQPYVDYSIENIERMHRMANMTLALNHDVANNMEHFRVVLQPVVSAGNGVVSGGEILLRWQFEGHDVSPSSFIPILEKENMIHKVGQWVFEQAVCTCVRLRAYDPTFCLTFNVSIQQLADPQLLPFMGLVLKKYQLSGDALVAELTESCLDQQPEKLTDFVNECQKLGIRIALDDFGSGYSSLRMLLQYPFSIIKLDRSLVMEVTKSETKMNFLRNIVFTFHQLGKIVCVEGVERADENRIILNTGCDMIQGYYYYRPMELCDIYQLVSHTNTAHEKAECE